MKPIDISPVLSSRSPIFPGDTPFEVRSVMSFKSGQNYELSAFTTSPHNGAHADAPSHYHKNGTDIASQSIHPYLGGAQVVRVQLNKYERIYPSHIKHTKILSKRILFSTGSFNHEAGWRSDFNSLSPELIEFLASLGVILVGIDTPSIDPADSKGLESHLAVFEHKIAVLENLNLNGVPSGLYQLIALPLKLKDLEASPVRAILLPNEAELFRM
jgi:arylformamidase